MPLVGYWPLTEDSGDAEDYSGNGNTGTVNGATQGASGILGQSAYSFDGVDDYTSVGTLGNFFGTHGTNFAISLWFKSSTTAGCSTCGSRNDTEWDNWMFFYLNRPNAGQMKFYIRDSDGPKLSGNTPDINANDGTWHHAVLNVIDTSTNNVEIWFDGANQPITFTDTGGPSNFVNFDNPFIIGARFNEHSIDDYFPGDITEFRIYDHALSPTEIQYLYDTSLEGSLRTEPKQG